MSQSHGYSPSHSHVYGHGHGCLESLGIVKFKSVCDSPMLVTLRPRESWSREARNWAERLTRRTCSESQI